LAENRFVGFIRKVRQPTRTFCSHNQVQTSTHIMNLILYHVCGEYWIDLTNHRCDQPTDAIVKIPPSAACLPSGKTLSRSQIELALNYAPASLPSGSSLAYVTPRVMAFAQARAFPVLSRQAQDFPTLEANAKLAVEQFRGARWKKISDSVYDPKCSLRDIVEIIMTHTFNDHYSLWLYNDTAEQFHLAEASFVSDSDWMSAKDPKCALAEVIGSETPMLCRPPKNGVINERPLENIRSISRFKIESNVAAVLSLYSVRENFSLSPYSARILPQIVRARLQSDIANAYIQKSRNIRAITRRYEIGALPTFLDLLLPRACAELGWEAASVYMQTASEGDKSLQLRATWSTVQKLTTLPVSTYKLDSSSLTGSVFISGEPVCVYDLEKDPRNSHGYDEPTANPAKNWVGIPIRRDGFPPVGVIRLKNRTQGQSIVPFNALDIKLIETIASTIGYAHHLEELHTKQQIKVQATLKETEQENRNLNEFIKTFRHELKSPLTVLTQAANTIERRLKEEGLITKKRPLPDRLVKALSDLDAVGSRLSLVTSYLTFDAHELVRERRKSRVFQEVVAPVTTFATSYAEKRNRIIEIRHETLTGYSAFCDPASASMVFHMILDNAIKYSDKDTKITVSGHYTNDYFGIKVTSTGTIIDEDERENIFLKYYRGREARSQKIEGSGIGLYLATEIMRLNQGKIVLAEIQPSVTFEVRFPSLNVRS
jgi:signal transduction histidine kinase